MDEALIENWNSVVKPGDKVYHLGDVYMGASPGYITSILQRLNGNKRLILGNHDNGKDQVLQRYFGKILLIRWFKEFGIVFSHIPMHEGSIKKGYTNVHGHIHEKKSPEGPYRNVCVEQTNYTPVHIEELKV
jgi:calcineurin-like phosphoesterase family protein